MTLLTHTSVVGTGRAPCSVHCLDAPFEASLGDRNDASPDSRPECAHVVSSEIPSGGAEGMPPPGYCFAKTWVLRPALKIVSVVGVAV